MKQQQKTLSEQETAELLAILEKRFEKHSPRHKGIAWKTVEARLLEAPAGKLWSLNEMEQTGGEPDVIGYDKKQNAYIFCDCAAESPKGRRSLCYDRDALDGRKENKPANSALDMADELGIKLLTEEEYRELQELGDFDTKTSSWVHTPTAIRERGGAIFCDRRYGTVFMYHNGAESYYAARGFRGTLHV